MSSTNVFFIKGRNPVTAAVVLASDFQRRTRVTRILLDANMGPSSRTS